MTTPTSPTPPEVRTATYELLSATFAASDLLSHFTVHRQDAGDEKGSSSITLGQIEGTRQTRGMRAGQQIPWTGIFNLPLVIEVREKPVEEGDGEAQAAMDLIDATLFSSPNVDLFNTSLHPGDFTGPNPYRTEAGQILSAARSVVEVHINT